MNKRLLVILSMAVVMLVGATIASSADDKPKLSIWDGRTEYIIFDGATVVSASGNIGGGSYSYDASTYTLTINNISLTSEESRIDASDMEKLNIVVVGNNEFNAGNNKASLVICHPLTITGNGKLKLSGGYGLIADTLVVDDVEMEIHGAIFGIYLYRDATFNGACNIEAYATEFDFGFGFFSEAGKVRCNLSKGGKLHFFGETTPLSILEIKDLTDEPIVLAEKNKITSPNGAHFILGGAEYSDAYIIVDSNENIVNELSIEYVEDAAGVNTADHTPMIIFAVMAMLVILGTTTVLLKNQK